MTMSNDIPLNTFAYTAQTFDGHAMTGTIDASDLDDASKRLTNLQLRVLRIDPAPRPRRAKALTGEDFAAFNQQLAHLSSAGLPIEQGLRLIAEDLHHGGLAQSIRDVSGELEKGVPLGEAFKRHERQFPPLYGTLIDAGVRTGNLPGVLLNLGRHLSLVARLRAALWSAAAYPLCVLGGMFLLLIFLGRRVLPSFQAIYHDFHTELPGITKLMMQLPPLVPWLVGLTLAIFVGLPLLWGLLRATRLDRVVADLALPLPLIGSILKRNLIARWIDALKLAVEAGMDLPAAVQLASDVVASPRLKRDSEKIIATISAGKHLDQVNGSLSIVPPTVLAVIQLSADRNDLPEALTTLSTMYQQQAELRLASVQGILTPILIICVAFIIAFVIVALFAPMISLIQAISSPGHK